MKEPIETYTLIERYLDNELGEEERIAFEEKISKDKDLAARVQAHQAADYMILGNRLMGVKKMMDADFDERTMDGSSRTKWWISGALLLLIVGSVWWFKSQQNENLPTVGEKRVTGMQQSPEPGNTGKNEETPSPDRGREQLQKKRFAAKDSSVNNIEKETPAIIVPDSFHSKQQETSGSFIPSPADEKENKTINTGCSGVTIEAEVISEPACAGNKDGTVEVVRGTLEGGIPPYAYILVHSGKDTLTQSGGTFRDLAAGQYLFLIQDKNKCAGAFKTVYIMERNCSKKESHAFNPSLGEVFNYPVDRKEEATVSILNKGGMKVREEHISNGYPESWNGTDQNGQYLSPGLYIYIIEYKSGVKETGEIILY